MGVVAKRTNEGANLLATRHLLQYRKDFVVMCYKGSQSEKSYFYKYKMTGVADHYLFRSDRQASFLSSIRFAGTYVIF